MGKSTDIANYYVNFLTCDIRKTKILKERRLYRAFSAWLDYIDDQISAKHK